MRTKQVILIDPKTVNRYCHIASGGWDRLFSFLLQKGLDRRFGLPSNARCTVVPPITLCSLEALFSRRCDVALVDEQVSPIDFGAEADLVGVTATTPQVLRAYEISRRFRARGIHTAIGGVHATCLPDEAAMHFDTVCVGEAEGYIEELLDDLNRGAVKRRYVNRTPVAMADVPFYRYPIASGRYLPFHVISFSRGCPFRCEYCSIRASQGGFRTREVGQVVAQIQAVGSKNLIFPDATLTADPEKARELFRALVPLKVRWFGQITLNVARDQGMLDLMADSGCWFVGVGFESLNQSNMRAARKTQNRVEDYAALIEALHHHNIAVEGDFLFGLDGDSEDVFDATVRFVLETGIDLPEFYMLTPYPDTELYHRLRAEGRIVDENWSHYDNTHFYYLPVFQPKQMSREALRDGCRRAESSVYSVPGTLRRMAKSRVVHPPVLIANYIYAARLRRRGDLIPVGDDYPGQEAGASSAEPGAGAYPC
jgi:radical SAM superfamily enzyme YgiQ (UPF0313 family)